MNDREELVKECRKIWDMDRLESKLGRILPETIKEMNVAINEQVDFIFNDRNRIVTPLIIYKNKCSKSWGDFNADSFIDETLKNAGLEA